MIIKKFLLIISLLLLLPILNINAATLFLESPQNQYKNGDEFEVDVRLKLDVGECVNLTEANIGYDKNLLEFISFNNGQSLLNLWPILPSANLLSINFAGGVPGGVCAENLKNDNNLIGKIFFKVKEETGATSSAQINFLTGTNLYLNDGLGTKITPNLKNLNLTLTKEPGQQKEWQNEIENDKMPPEPFEIEIKKDPSVYNNKYFIVFNTTDKQTGVDHYEISETKGGLNKLEEKWNYGQVPYPLFDQTLESIIKVKAIDKAGNATVSIYIPEKIQPLKPPVKAAPLPLNLPLIILIAIILLIIIFFLENNKKHPNKN